MFEAVELGQKVTWDNFERYAEFRRTSERTIQLTSTAEAPWTLVEATDIRHQLLQVGRLTCWAP